MKIRTNPAVTGAPYSTRKAPPDALSFAFGSGWLHRETDDWSAVGFRPPMNGFHNY